MNGNDFNPIEFRALQMLVVLIANTLRKNPGFRSSFDTAVRNIDTSQTPYPSSLPEESDHYSAEFQEAWAALARRVQMPNP